MQYYRCKCGEKSARSSAVHLCSTCPTCKSTLAQHPERHPDPIPHEPVTRFDRLTSKSYTICSRCLERLPDTTPRVNAKTSKFLSLILRHTPGKVGITLDDAGWVGVDILLEALAKHGHPLTRPELDEIVATNAKKRFAFSEDGLRIRASQGHSVDVDLGLEPRTPPEVLYHGTASANLDSIFARGLVKRSRNHVHLSVDEETASTVGARHGRPVVLRIAAKRMHDDGISFYLSDNGVWLVDAVPPGYISGP